MCEYCNKELGKSFFIVNDFTEKEINKEDSPLQYIRKFNNKNQLVTELSNDEGDVITTNINYCPMCGRKLSER